MFTGDERPSVDTINWLAPATRTTKNNTTFTVSSLATKNSWKDRESGEWTSRTEWHRTVVFGRLHAFAATLKKGNHVQIIGEIQTREYVAQNGAKKSVTQIRVRRIVRLNRTSKRVKPRRVPRKRLPGLEDLVSAGTIGLIQAVDRFDPKRNLKLKTLAEHRISGAMLDYLRRIDPLSRNVRRFQKRRDAIMADLSAAGEDLSHMRVAQMLGVLCRSPLSRAIAAAEPVAARDAVNGSEPAIVEGKTSNCFSKGRAMKVKSPHERFSRTASRPL